jgi:hypothetical protein
MAANEDTVPISIMLPPDIHPAVLKSGDPDARSAVADVYNAARKVKDTSREISEQGRPLLKQKKMTERDKALQETWAETQRAQQQELLRRSASMIEAAGTKADKAIATLAARIQHADGEIAKALVPRAQDGPMHTEIRAMIRSRGDDAISVVTSAINSGKRDVVAAVLGAPAMLSGLSDEHHQTLATLARTTLEGAKQKHLENLQRDLKVIQRSREYFLKEMSTFRDKWSTPYASIIDRGLK